MAKYSDEEIRNMSTVMARGCERNNAYIDRYRKALRWVDELEAAKREQLGSHHIKHENPRPAAQPGGSFFFARTCPHIRLIDF